MGTNLLVDLDQVVLDGDSVAASIGVLLYLCLDSGSLFWQDRCGVVFDQGDDAVDAFADGVARGKLSDWFALTLVCAAKVVAWFASLGLSLVERVGQAFATGVADWHWGSPPYMAIAETRSL